MFLAKIWVKRNGIKYDSWVLKKSVWDKKLKRTRQVYLAHLGKSTSLSIEKALKICKKIGVSLDELKAVRRLRVLGSPKHQKRKISRSTSQTEPIIIENVGRIITDLRKKYELPATPDGYQQLAMRIGVLHVTARELQNGELGNAGLRDDQVALIEQMLRSKRK